MFELRQKVREKISLQLFKRIVFISVSVLILFVIIGIVSRTYVYEENKYYSKDEVALYIYKYKKLPKNFITKDYSDSVLDITRKEAIEKGYNFGGDNFEYKGNITKYTNSKDLHECDIYLERSGERGTCRLVYDQYGKVEVYYTIDHYSTYKYVSKWSINALSNICYSIAFVLFLGLSFLFTITPLDYKINLFSFDSKDKIKKNHKKKDYIEVEAEEVKY